MDEKEDKTLVNNKMNFNLQIFNKKKKIKKKYLVKKRYKYRIKTQKIERKLVKNMKN